MVAMPSATFCGSASSLGMMILLIENQNIVTADERPLSMALKLVSWLPNIYLIEKKKPRKKHH